MIQFIYHDLAIKKNIILKRKQYSYVKFKNKIKLKKKKKKTVKDYFPSQETFYFVITPKMFKKIHSVACLKPRLHFFFKAYINNTALFCLIKTFGMPTTPS